MPDEACEVGSSRASRSGTETPRSADHVAFSVDHHCDRRLEPGAPCGSSACGDLCGGPAVRPVPTATVGVREGDGEALTGGVQAGLLSREIKESGVPTLLTEAEGNIAGGVIREPSGDPARSKTLRMYAISMRENREISRSSTRLITKVDRSGKAKAAILR